MRTIGFAVAALAAVIAAADGAAAVASSPGAQATGAATILVAGDVRANLVPKIYALAPTTGASPRNLGGADGDWDPQLSPDGASLAFVSARDGYPALYVARSDGSRPRRLTPPIECASWLSTPTWSPDGSRIVFEYGLQLLCANASRHLSTRAYTVHQRHELSVVDLDGRLRTYGVNGWLPVWSADGRALAYVEESTTSVTGGIGSTTGLLDVASGAHVSLGSGTQPVWSRDGARVALADGRGSVGIFARDGRRLRAIRANGAGWTACDLVTAAAGGIVLSADGTSSAFRTSNGIAVRRCGRRPTLVFRGAATPLAFAPSGGRLVARRRCRSGACPLLVVGGARPLDITARADTGTPVWSPDGRSIAFIAPDGHVLVVDAATGATLAAGDTGTATTTLGGWHGTELVYGTRAQPNASSIERLDPTTGEYEPLTIGAAPALSADGRTLAFTRAGGIWVRDANGAERLLAEVDATTLAWARDGRSLAYGSNDEIGVVTLDGARRRIVFAPRVVAGVLAWTPDSASIAYARRPEASEGTSVWLVSTDGRANRPFLSHAQSVAWSPDGSRLAYLTDGGGLSVAAADGSDPQVRAAVGFGYPVPTIAWSADGDTILVLRSVVHPVIGGSFSRVVAVAADGSGTVELTDGSTYLASLAIAP